MAWLAVDKDGSEYIYEEKPRKCENMYTPQVSEYDYEEMTHNIKLPKGTIEKILGRKLTFDDGAVNIK